MRWFRLTVLFAAMLFVTRANATEPSAEGNLTANSLGHDQTPAAMRAQAAPGGGEMMVVAPESRYAIRGHVDAGGHLSAQCEKRPAQGDAAGVTR